MEARGWLTWEAEVGRGKRSKLHFLYTGLALQQQRAEDLLEQDRIDQLVQLVGLTLQHADEIKAFEEERKAAQPWLFHA